VATTRAKKPATVAQYIAAAPKESRARLRELRALVAAVAPGATQSLKWGMPAFSYQRILVTFAAFKHHIGLFPTPAAVREFKADLAGYHALRATIRFPLDQPLPKTLIRRIVAFRVRQERSKDAKWRSRADGG
jgi:uncharacterized protein YdhG (YjbR/CyaY superfamily)